MSKLSKCWRCWHSHYEWLGWKRYWSTKGRCFMCRMDILDMKYGPGQQAELCKNKNGYLPTYHTSLIERYIELAKPEE